jgi:hypothetical protein
MARRRRLKIEPSGTPGPKNEVPELTLGSRGVFATRYQTPGLNEYLLVARDGHRLALVQIAEERNGVLIVQRLWQLLQELDPFPLTLM